MSMQRYTMNARFQAAIRLRDVSLIALEINPAEVNHDTQLINPPTTHIALQSTVRLDCALPESGSWLSSAVCHVDSHY